MRSIISLALVTVLAAGCASVPPDQDPTQIRLNDLDARVSKVERVVSNQSLVQLAQQADYLQGQVRVLQGRIDDLENSNRQLRKEQHDLYADLNKRVGALEHGGTAGGGGGSAPPSSDDSSQGVSSTERSVYGQAFDALKAGSYSVAIDGFQNFLKQYPSSGLAPNAEYWLGEAHYVNRDLAAAQSAFQAVLDRWPSSSKAPDAMFDLGNTQLDQGSTGKGRATLQRVVSQFPGTDAATRAQARLKQLSAQ